MSYKRFDRHECFTPEMMQMTREIIDEVMFEDMGLTNMVYGLYDGYLYSDILEKAVIVGVSQETMNKLEGLKKAIEMYIELTGETVTQIY